MTINPAIAAGSHTFGSIEPGKFADLVLWEPAFFGAKPKLVLKGGFIVWANMGDPNASLPTPQPMIYRPMFGAFGSTLEKTWCTFVSRAAYDADVKESTGCRPHRRAGLADTRDGQEHMVRNAYLPNIEVNPQTFAVTVDGVHATVSRRRRSPQPVVFLQLRSAQCQSVASSQMYLFEDFRNHWR